MNKIVHADVIEQRIFLIRGQKVMLSPHLAELYKVETRTLMQSVNRNRDRFPIDFMFPLTREEIKRISQSVISLKFSKSVYAFTEQGIAMLSSVLHSKHAVQINIVIMRAFVKLRQVLADHKELSERLTELENRMDKKDQEIITLFESIRRLMTSPVEKPKERIGFHPYSKGLYASRQNLRDYQ